MEYNRIYITLTITVTIIGINKNLYNKTPYVTLDQLESISN